MAPKLTRLVNRRKFFLFAFAVALSLVVFKDRAPLKHILSKKAFRLLADKIFDEPEYHVKTPTCSIPATTILTDYYRDIYFYENGSKKRINDPDCSGEVKLATTFKNGGNNWLLKLKPDNPSTFESMDNCKVSEIKRYENDDSKYHTIELGPLNEDEPLNITNVEMFITKCGNFENYDANIVIRPEVERKIDFWRQRRESQGSQQQQQNKPINVLLIGFDSTSRSNFYRAAPKSVQMLDELNFVSLRGFHSMHVHTLDNLKGILAGERGRDCNEGKPYFDNCPLIWKDYSRLNYVTMYLEDYTGSFQYKSEGFKYDKPTDFYLHPLFNAFKHKRINIPDNRLFCMSTETSPQFYLRYFNKFLKKFLYSPNPTPFFSFLYFNNPYHDNPPSLSDFDDDLEQFLKRTVAAPELLENTLIFIFGDHGERNGPFIVGSLESYVERSLPPLFVRVPESLKAQYPDVEFDLGLKLNARRLTSALDVHHTMLHVLSLTHPVVELGDSFRNFSAEGSYFPSKTSLFLPVALNRSCETLTVADGGQCVCNSTPVSQYKTIDNPYFVMQLIINATQELNHLVNQSRFQGQCKVWENPMVSRISAHTVFSNENYSDILLRFIGYFGDGYGKLEVTLRYTEGKGMTRIGEFSRIDTYGDQSSCVNVIEPKDSLMKGICICK